MFDCKKLNKIQIKIMPTFFFSPNSIKKPIFLMDQKLLLMRMIFHSSYFLGLFSCNLLLPVSASNSVFTSSPDVHLAASSNNKSQAHCLTDWISGPDDRKCFRYFMDDTSWEASEEKCESYKGHLAAVTSLQELGFVQQLCGKSASGCWIGGRGLRTEAGVGWQWSDNTSFWTESMISNRTYTSDCKKPSCNVTNLDLCTLVANGTSYISAQSCNTSHTFVCMLDAGSKCRHMHCHREYLIILFSVSGLIIGITLLVVVWLLVFKRSKRRRRSRKSSSAIASASASPSWKVFTREELKSITKNFSEGSRLLGDAKTGGAYSGALADGSRVAVKRLKRSSFQRKKEFYSEIGKLARLHHPNLVAVKGCCFDHGDRFIVYEFVVNGPLDRWLHHIPRGRRSLDWAMRIKVATTLAKGIAFLHDKLKPQVVHLDIRASNVLLDEEFGAHLMGVGLSKFVPWEVMHERRVVAGGTHGYLAPEFVYRNELTTKSDVYSFGVLLLEIISGRKPSQAVDSMGWQSIFEWATPLVQSNRYPELLDPLITSSSPEIPDAGVIQKVVDLVYSCTQHVPSVRPRMSHVFHQLQQLSQPSPTK